MGVHDAWAECAAYLAANCRNPETQPLNDPTWRYAMALWVLCEGIGAKSIIEIGIGRTSVSGCTFIHSLASRGGGSLLSIDINPAVPQARYKARAEELGVSWSVIYGDSLAVSVPEMQADLVYVDGAHDEEHAYADTLLLADRLRPGGYLVIDDCPGNEGVVNARDRLAAQGYAFIHIPHEPPHGNGRLVCQKPL